MAKIVDVDAGDFAEAIRRAGRSTDVPSRVAALSAGWTSFGAHTTRQPSLSSRASVARVVYAKRPTCGTCHARRRRAVASSPFSVTPITDALSRAPSRPRRLATSAFAATAGCVVAAAAPRSSPRDHEAANALSASRAVGPSSRASNRYAPPATSTIAASSAATTAPRARRERVYLTGGVRVVGDIGEPGSQPDDPGGSGRSPRHVTESTQSWNERVKGRDGHAAFWHTATWSNTRPLEVRLPGSWESKADGMTPGMRSRTIEDNGRWLRHAVDRLADELRCHHQPTADHSHRLARATRRLADRLGLDALLATESELVAIVHDVGKLAVPGELLHREGPLTPEEWRLVAEHPVMGERILRRAPALAPLAPLVRHEHEHWDGSGYPDGLRGRLIPVGSRIILACDAYYAMTAVRPYREALSPEEAAAELRRGAGVRFDPDVVEALLDLLGHDRPAVPDRASGVRIAAAPAWREPRR